MTELIIGSLYYDDRDDSIVMFLGVGFHQEIVELFIISDPASAWGRHGALRGFPKDSFLRSHRLIV